MPKKKSARVAADKFVTAATNLEGYCSSIDGSSLSDFDKTVAHEAALTRLNAEFEQLMLASLVAAINNDTAGTISARTDVVFPKHLTDPVCEYIVTGGGYFDFKGRDGLIKTLTDYLPNSQPRHYLVDAVRKQRYRTSLERLFALRNFAAHASPQSKERAKEAVGGNLSSAGAWIKRQGRFATISTDLKELAAEIKTRAPY
jgi:hypothetical protein